jgi:hypothetical protein
MCWSPVPRVGRGRNVRSTAPRWVGENCRSHRCSRGAGDVGSGFLESADPMASFTSASRKTSGLRRRHTQRLSSTSMPLQASFSLQDLKLFGPTPTRSRAGVGFTPSTESETAWSFWIADRSPISERWLRHCRGRSTHVGRHCIATTREDLCHRGRRGGFAEMLQHHAGAPNLTHRICDSLAGNVGRGAVHGFEETGKAPLGRGHYPLIPVRHRDGDAIARGRRRQMILGRICASLNANSRIRSTPTRVITVSWTTVSRSVPSKILTPMLKYSPSVFSRTT